MGNAPAGSWQGGCRTTNDKNLSALIYPSKHWISTTVTIVTIIIIINKSISHNNRRVSCVLRFELWSDQSGYEIFICGLLQGRHAVKKALIWQAKQTLMRPDNQWRHWWQCVVALGSERLDGLTVNNEWGDSWLISEVVSLSDTQLAFQWGLQHRRQHAKNSPTPTVLQVRAHCCFPTRLGTRCESIRSSYDDKKKCFLNKQMKTQSRIL